MIHQKHHHNIVVLILLGIILLFLLLAFVTYSYTSFSDQKSVENSDFKKNSTNTYNSSSLKFSVFVPEGFKIEERLTGVTLTSENGKVIIDKNGTNFSTIDDYLDDLSIKNKFSLNDKQYLTINSLPTIKLDIGSRRNYFVYGTDWTIYTISTNTSDLYDELDQIANSFKYTP